MDVKMITHTDMDGIGCAIVMRCVEPATEVFFCNYNDLSKTSNHVLNRIEEEHNERGTLIMSDIAPNKPEDVELLDNFSKYNTYALCVLDHHVTAARLNYRNWAKITPTKDGIPTSGTEMVFDEYRDILEESLSEEQIEVLKRFVTLVRDYDTWRWVDTGSEGQYAKKMNDLFYMIDRQKFMDWALTNIYSRKLDLPFGEYERLVKYREDARDSYINGKEKTLIDTTLCGKYTFGVVFAEEFISDLGNQLAERHPEYDGIAIVCGRSVSLRTVKDDVDVSTIAQFYGGGGHPKASGFPIGDKMEDILKVIFG